MLINNLEVEDIYSAAYKSGALTLENVIKTTFDKFHIRYLTTNVISRDNCLKREIAGKTMATMLQFLFNERLFEYLIKEQVRVKFVGDVELICRIAEDPDKLRDTIRRVEESTASFNKYYLIMLTAYDPVYEYVKLLVKNKELIVSPDDFDKTAMIRQYYGFDVPHVDFIIRTWWPRFSIIPILVGEHSDIYLFPGPQQTFNKQQYTKIVRDYESRMTSKDSGEAYKKGSGRNMAKLKRKLASVEPVLIGSKIDGVWIPLK